MAHRFETERNAWDATKWQVKKLPWDEKKPWFAYHPKRPLVRTATWAEAMARVCEELKEKQG